MTDSYLSFDGTGYIIVPSNAAFDLGTADFSVCFWMKPHDITTGYSIFGRDENIDSYFDIYTDAGKLYVELSEDSSPKAVWAYTTPVTIAMNEQWVFVTIIKTDSGIKIYFNNVEAVETEVIKSGNPNLTFATTDALIGCYDDNGTKGTFYVGFLDDIRIYKKALSTAEMVVIYNAGNGKEYTGAIDEGGVAAAAFNCDEAFGAKITDAVGGLVGQFYGGVGFIEGGVPFVPGLCTINDVKSRLGITTTDNDVLLTRIIAGVEAIFNKHVMFNLIAPASDITEYYTGCGRYLQLNSYPIISITSIKEAVDYDFVAATPLIANSDYRIVGGGRKGILYRISMDWFNVPDCTEIKWRGGFCAAGVTPAAGEFALPDDLREAAIMQTTLVFKRKDDIGLSSVGAQGGSASKFADMELLPMVKEILDNYKRII